MNTHPARYFKLSRPGKGSGVSCDAHGAFIDLIPLLKKTRANGKDIWQPRDCGDVSAELSARYGLPIDVSSKANGLAAIARALHEGSIARAQLAALFLRFPDPPPVAKSATSRNDLVRFIQELCASDLLKATWESEEHPRWPGGSDDHQGGRFAPKGEQLEVPLAAGAISPSSEQRARTSDTQLQHLRSWVDFATHEGRDAPVAGGPPLWMIMMFDGVGVPEAAEDFVSTLRPGPYARGSIPASGPEEATPPEQAEINKMGDAGGCHTCGTKTPGTTKGNWIGDHQPPTRLNPPLKPQRLYPHCKSCSSRQGGEVQALLWRVGKEFKEWYDAYARKRFGHRPTLLVSSGVRRVDAHAISPIVAERRFREIAKLSRQIAEISA